MDESVALLTKNTLAGKRTFVVTANAEIIMMAHEDPAYRELLLQRADLVLFEGFPFEVMSSPSVTVCGGKVHRYD